MFTKTIDRLRSEVLRTWEVSRTRRTLRVATEIASVAVAEAREATQRIQTRALAALQGGAAEQSETQLGETQLGDQPAGFDSANGAGAADAARGERSIDAGETDSDAGDVAAAERHSERNPAPSPNAPRKRRSAEREEPIMTRTMARLLSKQGLNERASYIYRALIARDRALGTFAADLAQEAFAAAERAVRAAEDEPEHAPALPERCVIELERRRGGEVVARFMLSESTVAALRLIWDDPVVIRARLTDEASGASLDETQLVLDASKLLHKGRCVLRGPSEVRSTLAFEVLLAQASVPVARLEVGSARLAA